MNETIATVAGALSVHATATGTDRIGLSYDDDALGRTVVLTIRQAHDLVDALKQAIRQAQMDDTADSDKPAPMTRWEVLGSDGHGGQFVYTQTSSSPSEDEALVWARETAQRFYGGDAEVVAVNRVDC